MERYSTHILQDDWKGMIKTTAKRAWPWFQGLLILMVVAYFWQDLSEGWAENQAVLSHFDGRLFLFAMLILSVVFPLLPIASKLTAELFQVHLSMGSSFQSYFYSQAGKYLPGGIWSYVGRVYLFNKQGIHKRTAFAITLMELLFLCVSGSFCFLISVYFWKQVPDFVLTLAIAAFFVFILCALVPFCQTMSSRILSRVGLDFNLKFQAKKLAFILLIYVCFWEGVGLGFYVLSLAMTPVSTNMVLVLAGIYPLAWIMGKVVFFMPAGIGVREGALVYLLGFFLNAKQAVWLSLVSRLWWIAAEVLCVAMVLAWHFFSKPEVSELK